jgi:hypothetical protein
VKIGSTTSDPAGQQLGQVARLATSPFVALSALDGTSATLVEESGTTRHYRATGGSGGPADLYVDAQDRPTRITMSDGVDVTFSDWGAPVSSPCHPPRTSPPWAR